MTTDEQIAAIRAKLNHNVFERPTDHWLDTCNPLLNRVLGSESLGLPYGKVMELYGQNSHGKSVLALYLAGIAQVQGAAVIWMDFEGSFDPAWAKSNGLDPNGVYLLQPQVGRFRKKTGDPRLQSAEELLQECQELIKAVRQPERPVMMVVDSVASMLVEQEEEAGIVDQNMRTKLSLSQFMSPFLRRWTSVCHTQDVLTIFINQTRTNPNAMFGNPETTPGGDSLGFYASIRARVARVKGGQLKKKGEVIGLKGKIKNVKNKSGGGSREGHECGYICKFGQDYDAPTEWKFMPVKDAAAEE